MNQPILSIHDPTGRHPSFQLVKGKMLCVSGESGSGKSHFLKTLYHLEGPGDSFSQYPAETFYISDRCIFPGDYTAHHVSQLMSCCSEPFDKERFDAYLTDFEIPSNLPIRHFNRSMELLLMLAAGLSKETRLLIIDEPVLEVHPKALEKLQQTLKAFISDGQSSVLYATRYPDALSSLDHQVVPLSPLESENKHE